MDYFHFCDITLRPNCKWGRAYCCIFLLLWKYLAPPISVNGRGKAETMARWCLFLQISFPTQIVWYLPNESNLLEIFPLNKSIKCKNSVTQWLGLTLLWCSKQYIFIFPGDVILLSAGVIVCPVSMKWLISNQYSSP